jgi:hypothetical protein
LIEKLKELKRRTENLPYKDEKELDDIIRKTKMYVEKLFPMKPTYSSEITLIKFKPSFFVSGMGEQPYRESWTSGQQKLINFLDTRIEEKALELKAQPKTNPEPKVIEKIVMVQDNSRIDELTQENAALRRSKSLWNKINWAIFIPILLTVLGGAFVLGIYIGKAQFDREKLELFEKNKVLESQNDSLKNEINSANEKIQNLVKLVPEDIVKEPMFPLEVEISFISPTSIFDGEILITAREDISDKAILVFKGIMGLSRSLSDSFDGLEIKVEKGDRFYFKSELGNIYTVNVLSSNVDVDLEIIERK